MSRQAIHISSPLGLQERKFTHLNLCISLLCQTTAAEAHCVMNVLLKEFQETIDRHFGKQSINTSTQTLCTYTVYRIYFWLKHY